MGGSQWRVRWTVEIMRTLHEDLIAAFPFVNGDDIPFSVSVQCLMPSLVISLCVSVCVCVSACTVAVPSHAWTADASVRFTALIENGSVCLI